VKNLAEFETQVQLPDGEYLPVLVSIVNRQIVVKPARDEERYQYIQSIESVMSQVKMELAERVGHAGQQNVVVSPTWGVNPSQFLPLLAQNNTGVGLLHLVKGAWYAVIVWQGAANENLDIIPLPPGGTKESIRAEWQRQDVTILNIILIEGGGQIFIMPAS